MQTDPVKLSCRNIWKVFGPGGDRFLRDPANPPDRQAFARAGLVVAAENISLDVVSGKILVVMGLSGSGKSTLVRLMSRLIEPTAGELIFEGRDLRKAGEKELIEIRRHKMGMVFQSFALLPHRTVLGNVAFPLEVQGIDRATRESKAAEIIRLVGLAGRECRFPRELSGGQQQRVGIARSLIAEPHIWFLDEPFSALDPIIRREMQDEFLRLQNEFHKTIVFITHDFEEAVRLADRIAIMRDGRIIQIGTPEELLLTPADDYVRQFTRHVTRAKVLSARSIMQAPLAEGGYDGSVRTTERIEDVADRVERAARPFAVEDEAGHVVGSIDRQSVLDVLIGRETAR